MQGGKSWRQQLSAAIEECHTFLYIATANAQISETCQEELQHAALMRKPCVTVVLQTGVVPPQPLDDHQTVLYDRSGKAVARLMRALQDAKPLRRAIIPDDWRTLDGKTKLALANSMHNLQATPSPYIRRDLTVVEKHDFLHNAIAESVTYFENALREMQRSDSRIESRIGHNYSSGFACFISLEGQLIKGCRIYINADFNGISYDGNTNYAVQWKLMKSGAK